MAIIKFIATVEVEITEEQLEAIGGEAQLDRLLSKGIDFTDFDTNMVKLTRVQGDAA